VGVHSAPHSGRDRLATSAFTAGGRTKRLYNDNYIMKSLSNLRGVSSGNSGSAGGRGIAMIMSGTLLVLFAGTAASLILMFRVGRNNPSVILLALFTIWVLCPFVALACATLVSGHWPGRLRALLYGGSLLLTTASVAAYAAVALGPPKPKPAAMFLVTPFVSWLLIAMAGLSFRRSLRSSRT